MAVDTVDRQSISTKQAVAYLRDVQARQVEELSAMLGREFPEWKTLFEAEKVDA